MNSGPDKNSKLYPHELEELTFLSIQQGNNYMFEAKPVKFRDAQ